MIRFLNFAQEKPMTEQRDSQSVRPGDEIAGRYKSIEKLGEGGMGSVYKAHDKILGRSVAVKVLNVSTTSQDDVVRFHREAKAASQVVHPNVIKVLDFGITESGQPYMVMEFVNGRNLHELVKSEGALPMQLSLELVEQICDGMIAVHRAGIVHRDLKAGNIMVVDRKDALPEVKILDFGIAKSFTNSQESTLTQAGHILGSPRYMSPEQARGEQVDERTDIYSLGCITFEMLTGEPLFSASTALETMALHAGATAPTLAAKSSFPFPDQLEELVAQAVAKYPSARFASMVDFKQAVDESLSVIEKSRLAQAGSSQQIPASGKKAIAPQMVIAWTVVLLAGIATISFACYKIRGDKKVTTAPNTRESIVLKQKKIEDYRNATDLEFSEASDRAAGAARKPQPYTPGNDPFTSQAFSEKRTTGTLSALLSGLSGDTDEFQEGKLSILATPATAGTSFLGASKDPEQLDQIEKLCARHATIENIVLHRLEIEPARLAKALTLKPLQVVLLQCNLKDEHLKEISGSDTIEYLILEKNPDITQKGLRYLSRMPDLQVLNLGGCNVDRKKMEALVTLPKLSTLLLHENPKVSPRDLELVLPNKSLKFVCVNNTAAAYLPKALKALEAKYKKTVSSAPIQWNADALMETMSFAEQKIR